MISTTEVLAEMIGTSPNFDAIARPYRWMEYLTFGPLLERCRFAHLDRLGDPRRALILGDGDGRFAARLLARYPRLTIDVIELSPAMVRLARQRLESIGASDRAHFYIADMRVFTPPAIGPYDLVASHFFLDCFTDDEVGRILDRLRPCLTGGATWVVSEFAVPANSWLRLASRILIAGLYFSFRLLTGLSTRSLPDYSRALENAGFACVRSEVFLGGILRSERWQSQA